MQELNRKPNFYCLPYGVGNQFVNDVVTELELSGVTTTQERLVNAFENAYDLPRIMVKTDIMHFYRCLARGYGKAFLKKMHLLEPNY